MSTHLFVYGTLMRGEERDGLVAHLPATPASVRGQLWRVPAGYPALYLDPAGIEIRGELLQLENESILMVLDLYEGVSEGLYSREVVPITVRGMKKTAWVYVMSRAQLRIAGCQPLKTDDWRTVSPKQG